MSIPIIIPYRKRSSCAHWHYSAVWIGQMDHSWIHAAHNRIGNIYWWLNNKASLSGRVRFQSTYLLIGANPLPSTTSLVVIQNLRAFFFHPEISDHAGTQTHAFLAQKRTIYHQHSQQWLRYSIRQQTHGKRWSPLYSFTSETYTGGRITIVNSGKIIHSLPYSATSIYCITATI